MLSVYVNKPVLLNVFTASENGWMNTKWMMIILAAVIGGLALLLALSFLCYRLVHISSLQLYLYNSFKLLSFFTDLKKYCGTCLLCQLCLLDQFV